jgi:hypothetical protein
MNKEHSGQKRVLGKLNRRGRNNFLSEPVVSMPIRWQWISTVRNVWVASVDPVSGFAVIRQVTYNPSSSHRNGVKSVSPFDPITEKANSACWISKAQSNPDLPEATSPRGKKRKGAVKEVIDSVVSAIFASF